MQLLCTMGRIHPPRPAEARQRDHPNSEVVVRYPQLQGMSEQGSRGWVKAAVVVHELEAWNMAPEDIKAAIEAVYLLIQILNQLAPTMRAVHKSLRTRRNLRKSGDMQEANGSFYRLSRAY